MGMLPLEIRRFKKKLQQLTTTKEADDLTKSTGAAKVLVHMPSSSFGHAVVTKTEEELKREYPDMYYECPQNYKQKVSNQFSMNMCSPC